MKEILALLIIIFYSQIGYAQSTDNLTRDNDLRSKDIYNVPDDRVQRNVTEFDFCPRIRLRLISGIQPRYTQVQMDSIARVRFVEDSIYYESEKKRCAWEKDSVRFANLPRLKNDSIKYIGLSDFGCICKGDHSEWGIIRGGSDSRRKFNRNEMRKLDSLVNAIPYIDTKSPSTFKVNPEWGVISRLHHIVKCDTTRPENLVEKIERYENGNLKEQGTLACDKKNGIWKSYYENGNIKIIATYNKQGILEGEYKEYAETGGIIFSGKYINGEKIGKYYE
jgi:hypothetical protein